MDGDVAVRTVLSGVIRNRDRWCLMSDNLTLLDRAGLRKGAVFGLLALEHLLFVAVTIGREIFDLISVLAL